MSITLAHYFFLSGALVTRYHVACARPLALIDAADYDENTLAGRFFYLAMATNAAAGSGYLTLAMIFSSSAASVLS